MASRDLRIVNMVEGQKAESDKVFKRIGEISYRDIGVLSKIGLFDSGKALITSGLRVVSGGGMTVSIPMGNILQRMPSGDLLPCIAVADQTLTMDSASGVSRVDIVECQVKSLTDKDDVSQAVLDSSTGVLSVETIKRDIKYYLSVQKKMGSTTATAATAGVLSGTVGIAGTIDLSANYLLNLADGEDGSFQEIDLRGVTPQATTLAEIVANINAAVGRTMASVGGGNVAMLTGYGTGISSYFEIKPPVTDSDADVLQVVFGVSSSGAYDYIYKGVNDWIKLAEIDIGAATTVITSGLIRNIDQKSTWASDSTDIITAPPAIQPLSERTEQLTIADTDLIPIETATGKSLYATALNLRQGKANIIVPTEKTDDYNILDTDIYTHYILRGAGANKTFTLPTLADNINKEYVIWNNDTTYMLTVDGEGSETIDGMLTIQLPKQGNYIRVVGTASEWKILGESISAQLRLNTFAGYGSTDNKIMQFTNLAEYYGNIFSHNHGSYGVHGLEVIINKTGKYFVGGTSLPESAGDDVGISVNSNQLTTAFYSINSSNFLTTGHTAIGATLNYGVETILEKNDVLRVHTNNAATSSTYADKCTFILSYIET